MPRRKYSFKIVKYNKFAFSPFICLFYEPWACSYLCIFLSNWIDKFFKTQKMKFSWDHMPSDFGTLRKALNLIRLVIKVWTLITTLLSCSYGVQCLISVCRNKSMAYKHIIFKGSFFMVLQQTITIWWQHCINLEEQSDWKGLSLGKLNVSSFVKNGAG